jgi:hypothetical protein
MASLDSTAAAAASPASHDATNTPNPPLDKLSSATDDDLDVASSASPEIDSNANLFSNGLYNSIIPAINSLDSSINQVYSSQHNAAQQIDKLAQLIIGFQQLSTNNPNPIDFHLYINKIKEAKKKIKRINTTVNNINNRIIDCRNTIRKREGLNSVNKANTAASSAHISSSDSNNPTASTLSNNSTSTTQPQSERNTATEENQSTQSTTANSTPDTTPSAMAALSHKAQLDNILNQQWK